MSTPSRILLIMGVAGSGKTTIGQMVSTALGWTYFEADDFHSQENKAKMRSGLPLDDDDRAPWLAAIRAQMDACRAAQQNAIFTCSALKERYRTTLGIGSSNILLVHLTGDLATIRARLEQREGHYMKGAMLQSQIDALEPPGNALTIDVALPPNEIVQTILQWLDRAE